MKTYQRTPDEPNKERLFVDISEYEVVDDGTTLVAYGLGACVGLIVYDPENRVGGLARAMLPRQSDGSGTSNSKYVDAAIEAMVRDAISAGAGYGVLEGYIVGGSNLLDLQQLSQEVSEENVTAARETFANLDVPVEASAVGGHQGRTVEFNPTTGEVRVITVHDSDPIRLRTAGNREG